MIPVETLFAFAAAATILALAPGPDNIFVLTQSALSGPRFGLLVTLGLCTGIAVHSAAVAVGLAALIAASATAFTVLKLAGAAYLLWLAWGAFRAPAARLEGQATDRAGLALYRRGVIMNVLNPKVAIFFLAFFPQFIDPARGSSFTQIVTLGAVFMIVTLLVFSSVALLAGSLSQWLIRTPRAQLAMNRTAGVVFVGLAAAIALGER